MKMRSLLVQHLNYLLHMFEYKVDACQTRKHQHKFVTPDKGYIAENAQNVLANLNFCWMRVEKSYLPNRDSQKIA